MEYLSELLKKNVEEMTDEELEQAINDINGMRQTFATQPKEKTSSAFEDMVRALALQTGLPIDQVRKNIKNAGKK